MSEGSDPSGTSDDGSRSTPSNLPKAATRTRKKRTSDSEDEDYVAVEDEATLKKKVLKKEYGSAAATKPGLKTKMPARRQPMSKGRKVATGETMKFTIESKEEAAGEDKKKRARTTTSWQALNEERFKRGRGRGCCTSSQGLEAYGRCN